MAATFEGRPMHGLLTGAEISYGELAHVTNNLAMRKMQTGLPLADQRGVGDHCERDGGAGCILEVDDLRRGGSVCVISGRRASEPPSIPGYHKHRYRTRTRIFHKAHM